MEFCLKMFEAGCQQNDRLGNSKSLFLLETSRNWRTNFIGVQKTKVYRSQVNAPSRKPPYKMVGNFMAFLLKPISPHPMVWFCWFYS